MMNERQSKILCAAVQSYIHQGEPVASKSLVADYSIGCSPATVRTDMAWLEEQGYLYQPHTSAGRVPTDNGYRYYVDFINQKQTRVNWQRRQFLLETEGLLGSINDVLQNMSKQVSDLLTCMTVITTPAEDDIFYSGLINLLGQPEFNDVNKIRKLLTVIEEKKQFIEVIQEQLKQKEAYMLRIGSEINSPELADCSLLASRYYYHEEPAGILSLIMVKRISYDKIAPAFAELVSEFNNILERID